MMKFYKFISIISCCIAIIMTGCSKTPVNTTGTDTGNEDKRNGSYMIRSSKYTGGMSTTSAPVFTGSPTRTYDFKGYGYGYNKTPNAPEAFINTGVNCWSELERVNDNVFALYTHVPGQGFSKSFITAVKPGI